MHGKCYRHSWLVRFVVGLAPFLFGHLAFQAATAPFIRGGLPVRIVLVALVSAITVCLVLVFLRSALLCYVITGEGLILKRPWSARLVPWDQITGISWNGWLRYICIYDKGGRVAFSSTDGFPRLVELIQEIHSRSQCRLPSWYNPDTL